MDRMLIMLMVVCYVCTDVYKMRIVLGSMCCMDGVL